MGACLATEKAAAALTAGSHGSTFGGNPLAMAVANAVLDVVLADGFLDRVDAVARLLWGRLESLVEAHPKVLRGLRGAGLMVGLACVGDNRALVARLRDNGLLAIPAADNVVRLLPPLIIAESHVDEAMAILERSCAELADRAA